MKWEKSEKREEFKPIHFDVFLDVIRGFQSHKFRVISKQKKRNVETRNVIDINVKDHEHCLEEH